MDGLGGLEALDVAIGLALYFIALSVVCSTINEALATAFAWRAETLILGLRKLLGTSESVDAVLGVRQVERLVADDRLLSKSSRAPSYLPARVFSLAALDTLAPEVAEKLRTEDPSQPPSADLMEDLEEQIATVDNDAIREMLGSAVGDARANIGALRGSLEQEFDAVMDRASGWYRRKARFWLTAIAILVVGVANADAISLADRLSKDDALRASVVSSATQQIKSGQPSVPAGKDTEADDEEDLKAELQLIAERVDDVEQLGFPLGWSDANTPEASADEIVKKVTGLLLTVIALSLGAPFWFDVLGKFAAVRLTGKREGTTKDDDRAAIDRDERPRGRGRRSPA